MYTNYNRGTSINSNLPFIPPPDYSLTIKNKYNASNRPQLQNLSSTRPKLSSNNEKEQQHELTVYTDFYNNDHILDLTDGRIFPSPGNNNNIRDEDYKSTDDKKEETKNRVLNMLKKQGIPVFPGLPKPTNINNNNVIKKETEQPTAVSQNGLEQHQHLGPTRAYIKHLENHRKYDTRKSFDSCDKCPICRQMRGELELLAMQSKNKKISPKSESLITTGKVFQPLNILEEDEPEEDADLISPTIPPSGYVYIGNGPSTSSNSSYKEQQQYRRHDTSEELQTARARNDWIGQESKQLSVSYGETLKVSKMGQDWIYCSNKQGLSGWVPSNQLYLMPGGYY